MGLARTAGVDPVGVIPFDLVAEPYLFGSQQARGRIVELDFSTGRGQFERPVDTRPRGRRTRPAPGSRCRGDPIGGRQAGSSMTMPLMVANQSVRPPYDSRRAGCHDCTGRTSCHHPCRTKIS